MLRYIAAAAEELGRRAAEAGVTRPPSFVGSVLAESPVRRTIARAWWRGYWEIISPRRRRKTEDRRLVGHQRRSLAQLTSVVMALAVLPTRPKTLAAPGRAEKSSIWLFRRSPVPWGISIDPNAMLMVDVHATALPSLSTTETCDVPPSSSL